MTKKSDAPAIRFKGFSDAWEQRKLGELVDVCSGRDYKHLSEGTIPVYGTGGYMLSVNDALSYDRDAIGIGRKGTIDRPYILKAPFWTVDTLFYAIPREKVDLNFAFDIFQNIDWKKKDESTGVPSLSKTAINDIDVLAPKHGEQQTIGQFFAAIDHLITLHQRELEKLQNIKKSMLEKMFPQNGSSYPEIRFKGFTDPWEQRKLSEITDKVTEKNSGLQYVETFTNSAEFGIISQRDFFDHDIAKLGSLDGYYIVKNEDFVYNPRISTSAPVGPINRNKLGRTGVMSPLYTVFRPHDIDTTYLEYFFKCGYWHSFMNFNGDSGARSDRFSIRDNVFFQMPIPIPDIDEQRKIGELLTCLDNLITLHQRELEKLQNIKKSMLEKMFV
jgi:restriction endonuclease S subunit